MNVKYILLAMTLWFSQASVAQETETPKHNGPILVTLPIQRDGFKVDARFISNQLSLYLRNAIGEKYTSSFSTLYKVVPSYIVTDVRVIETMDTRVYADLEIYARLRGYGFHKDSLLRMYSATGSGESEKAAIQKAANTILSAGGPMSTFRGVVDSLFNERYAIHGDQTLTLIKGMPQTTIKECDNVLTELIYFSDFPTMATKAESFRNEVKKKKSQYFCKEELPQLKIKIESTVYDVNQTVDKLLAVSPESSCSGEVLQLAKLIGQQQQAKQASVPDQLNVLVTIHQDRNVNLWRERYY
jgi:hypothetical protein